MSMFSFWWQRKGDDRGEKSCCFGVTHFSRCFLRERIDSAWEIKCEFEINSETLITSSRCFSILEVCNLRPNVHESILFIGVGKLINDDKNILYLYLFNISIN